MIASGHRCAGLRLDYGAASRATCRFRPGAPAAQRKSANDATIAKVAQRAAPRWALVLTAAGMIGAVFAGGAPALGAARPGFRGTPTQKVRVSTVQLPGRYSVLATVGDKLLLTGPPSDTDLPGPDLSCGSVVVDPVTLKVGKSYQASCADPRLWGEAVLPVFSVEQNVFWGHGSKGINTGEVRMTRLSRARPGYRLGPVVLTYPNASGRPQWTTGDGYLWLYSGTSGPQAEVLRISLTTGAVLQRVTLPDIVRPILAVDDDGLWIAPAVNSFYSAGSDGIWRVGPGARSATLVRRLTTFADWVTATGHLLFADIRDGSNPRTTLWRLDGPDGTVAFHRVPSPLLEQAQVQYSTPVVVANSSGALCAVVPNSAGTGLVVLRLNPMTGFVRALTTVAAGLSVEQWQVATEGTSLYVLLPDESELVRVAPSFG
jgi:hypothetical protein